jgi:hypothetical protein
MTQISQISDLELKNDYDMQPIKQQYFTIPANIQVKNKSKKHISSNSANQQSTIEKTKEPSRKIVTR